MFLYSLGVFCFKGRRNLNSSPKNFSPLYSVSHLLQTYKTLFCFWNTNWEIYSKKSTTKVSGDKGNQTSFGNRYLGELSLQDMLPSFFEN